MAFESLLRFGRMDESRLLRASESGGRAGSAFVLERGASETHDEHAFRDLVRLERERAILAKRWCLLLLASLRRHPVNGTNYIPRSVRSSLLAGLHEAVREVDIVGWYRQEHVLGALLPQGNDSSTGNVPGLIVERVRQGLRRRLGAQMANRLRIRAVRLGSQDNR